MVEVVEVVVAVEVVEVVVLLTGLKSQLLSQHSFPVLTRRLLLGNSPPGPSRGLATSLGPGPARPE